MSESRSLAEKAWNKVKAKEDPEFAATVPDHQRNLEAAAADVVATGVTINDFEREVARLSKETKSDEPRTALGTSEPRTALGTSEPKAETKTAKAEAKEEAPAKTATTDKDSSEARIETTTGTATATKSGAKTEAKK